MPGNTRNCELPTHAAQLVLRGRHPLVATALRLARGCAAAMADAWQVMLSGLRGKAFPLGVPRAQVQVRQRPPGRRPSRQREMESREGFGQWAITGC